MKTKKIEIINEKVKEIRICETEEANKKNLEANLGLLDNLTKSLFVSGKKLREELLGY